MHSMALAWCMGTWVIHPPHRGSGGRSSSAVRYNNFLAFEVYVRHRSQFRLGHDTLTTDVLISLLNKPDRPEINYIKLKFIIKILNELKICGVESTGTDRYKFDVYFSASKTNIEKSSILKMLRSQCRNRV